MGKRMKKRGNYLESLEVPITPETTVIVFDLHNVVFKSQRRKIVFSCLKLMRQGTWRYTLNPALWYKVYRLRTQSDVAEDIFHKVTAAYPELARFRNDFIRITNTQKPIRGVVDLIKKLKERGYKTYVLSNIGKETFEQLCLKYPDIRTFFDGAFTATAEQNYLHKPHMDFYKQFKDYLKDEGLADKQILFIDDLKRNLAAAASCNIAGVHYRSSRRLLHDFKNLHIF